MSRRGRAGKPAALPQGESRDAAVGDDEIQADAAVTAAEEIPLAFYHAAKLRLEMWGERCDLRADDHHLMGREVVEFAEGMHDRVV